MISLQISLIIGWQIDSQLFYSIIFSLMFFTFRFINLIYSKYKYFSLEIYFVVLENLIGKFLLPSFYRNCIVHFSAELLHSFTWDQTNFYLLFPRFFPSNASRFRRSPTSNSHQFIIETIVLYQLEIVP